MLALAACGSSSTVPAREKPVPPLTANRQLTAREKLPEVVKPLLPQRGFYAAGGGMVSSAWRVVVDRDAKTIYAGTAAGPNAASFGKMEKEATRPLSERNDGHLAQLAEAAWREQAAPNVDVTADYDEILILVDGPDAFFLQGYGP